jgi:immune inhibitor A
VPNYLEALFVRKLFTIFAALAFLLSMTVGGVEAKTHKFADNHKHKDNLSSPLAKKQNALRATARQMVLNGEATPKGDNQIVKVAKGQYVQLAFTGSDHIFTLLGEFGDTINSPQGGDPGPVHNQIPEPDRTVNNVDIWAPDFSREYYENLLFAKGQVPSMANWYLQSSSGRYTVDGYVSDWVKVDNNEATYGTDDCNLDGDLNDNEDSIVCPTVWDFVKDQANAWWDATVADMGEAAAKALLQSFDVWDRYDYDGDGNVNEPDGYIDHFQSVHAGMGEETNGGAQGADAIWSHRWYAFFGGIGSDGPAFNQAGGLEIGDSGIWIGDYTIEPENGGVGVFTHEFGHDLGLPDEYDTSGNTGGAENGTAWWTNWSQGSYGTIDENGLGMFPVSMDAWEKFQLGWLNYGVGVTGKHSSFRLGPVEANTRQLQGVFVVLPDKHVTKNVGAPFSGANFYYSGAADDLSTTMSRQVTLPAGTVGISAKARWNIERGFDYAFLKVNNTYITTNVSNSTVKAEGIEGVSPNGDWTDLTADLSAFAGQTVTITFGYLTDGGVQGATQARPAGFALDDIAITGQALDDAEGTPPWTFATNSAPTGFHVTSGSEEFEYFNAYLAEFRQYRDYDKALQLGPYNFTTATFVEHFPYQDGLLIWYWDTSFADNNVGDHPGGGEILPIDAHPGVMHWADGSVARPRIQSYDATFGFQRTQSITLHGPGGAMTWPSLPAVPKFDDTKSYWVAGDPGDNPTGGRYQSEWNSVNVPHTGTSITVVSVGAQGSFMQIHVN